MKLKIDKETKHNIIQGKASQFQRIFKKVDEGLSSGKLEKIEIFKDKIKVYIGE